MPRRAPLTLGQHATDLEREQRVSERRLDESPQKLPRKRQPEPVGSSRRVAPRLRGPSSRRSPTGESEL